MKNIKKELLDSMSKLAIIRNIRTKHHISSFSAMFLSEEEISCCADNPQAQADVVKAYFKRWPKRFYEDRKTAEKIVKTVCTTEAERSAFQSKLLFYRIAYGFHPEEYLCYEMEDKTIEEIRTFVSAKECHSSAYRMNDLMDMDIFNNKGKTYAKFGNYYGREAAYIEKKSDYKKYMGFVQKHPVFVKKAVFEAMGRSVEKINLLKYAKTADELFWELIQNGAHILEECVQQCDIMATLNTSSVNTVRSITFNTNHGIKLPYFFIKVGRAGSFVDNGGAGGVLVGIDAETGKLCTDGYDEMNRCYEKHPDSGIVFNGFQLPEWDNLKALSEQLSSQIPTVKYIGWDFAHTDAGWLVIEGNGRSQIIGPQTVFKRGVKAEVEALMKDIDLIC